MRKQMAKACCIAVLATLTSLSTPALAGSLAPANAITANSLTPLQVANLINGIRDGLAQRTLSAAEVTMLDKLRQLANDMDFIYEGDNGDPSASKALFERHFHARMGVAQQVAEACYGRSSARVTLARNAYILMSYDALVRHDPDFFWARLGIFAANEVRSNLALAFSLKGVLDTLIAADPGAARINIAGMSLASAAQLAGEATTDLIEGQSNVLANIGSLALLHKRYGAKAMGNVPGLSPEAIKGYALQQAADEARATSGPGSAYHQWATQAAIQFGMHEQTYLLQPMWDKPAIKAMAQLNNWTLSNSLETLGMRGDIFIGANKFQPYLAPYLIIRAPVGATNLASVTDRIAIARNGFTVLDGWNQNALLSGWIQQAQSRLGQGKGLYQPVSAR